MRSNGASARVYRSFQEFEKEELQKFDGFTSAIDGMLDDMAVEELDFSTGDEKKPKRGRKPANRPNDDF